MIVVALLYIHLHNIMHMWLYAYSANVVGHLDLYCAYTECPYKLVHSINIMHMWLILHCARVYSGYSV